ncbi:hypothetical protein HOLleu_23596 [Holothuria leucospilota]|uniref:Uncharacterized protein n=1 Tax=Holothuria leucospilota TaxID=206669 RepID=A0A9Q1BV26_HOLLE|nr:hypothetical protein HOLleu_23596 [Holothuria leucospilota]
MKSTQQYQEALKESGYNYELEYKSKEETKRKHRARKRNITWFNPPFDLRVKTNVGRQFLKIVTESFPKGHTLQIIFNRNTLKISYSCMPNMKSIVDAHNKKILKAQMPAPETDPCNCRAKQDCPLDGKCKATSIVYQATVKSDNYEETYVGLTEGNFKLRLANHQQSFNKERYRNQTELSKHIWTLKDRNKDFEISWRILSRASSFSNVSKRCNLCTMEKFFIICHPEMASLNKRSELVSTCRHASKFQLMNFAGIT